VFLGTVIDESMPEGEIRVTVIATGFHRPSPLARAAEQRQMDLPRTQPEPRAREWQAAPASPPPVREAAAASVMTPMTPVTPMSHASAPAPVVSAPVVPTPIVPVPVAAPVEHVARVAEPVARMEETRAPIESRLDDEEPVLDFPEILARGDSVIEFATEPEDDEPVIMDNGSIRSFNTEVFRIPTFVRKQMD
jgi:hypothetical protein